MMVVVRESLGRRVSPTYLPYRPDYTPMHNDAHAGCGDACPWMPAKHHINWVIPDPKHMEPEEFNKASGERDDAV